MECRLVSGGRLRDKGGSKARQLKFPGCLELHIPYFIHKKTLCHTMIQLRLVIFSELLKLTQLRSGQTGKSTWFFVS